jgi:hypothetical protein
MRTVKLSVRLAGALKALASPRLMVAFFVLMAAAALGAASYPENITAIVLPPLVLLFLNLSASILSNARFRADLPLLLFHLALLAFLALLLTARLSYFDGGATLRSGGEFNGEYLSVQKGLLHGNGASRLRFANDGLTEHPVPGSFPTTYNLVRWWDSAGLPHMTEIGNDRPLVLNDYRIYATNMRGFEPIFQWQRKSGAPEMGGVQLPYTFAGDFPEASLVNLPGGGEAWVQLVSSQSMELQGKRDDLGAQTLEHKLILRAQGNRYEMQPGTAVELPDGRLTYVRLGSWLGYRVTYDPTPPWLAASVLVGVTSLVWFYARLWRRSQRSSNVE